MSGTFISSLWVGPPIPGPPILPWFKLELGLPPIGGPPKGGPCCCWGGGGPIFPGPFLASGSTEDTNLLISKNNQVVIYKSI